MSKRTSFRAPPLPEIANVGLGIMAMVAGVSCAALQAAISKTLTDDLPVSMIVWWRFLGILIIVLPVAAIRHPRLLVIPPLPTLQIARGILLILASITFVHATSRIPLAEAISIAYVYPFVVTALATIYLGERVLWTSWLAVLGGFIGVLIVMRPSIDGFSLYSLLALVAGLCFAIVLLLSRKLAGPSPTFITSTWTAAVALAGLSFALPSQWVTPDPAQFLLLVGLGIFSAASQILVVFACSKADMSVLAPFGYIEIVIAAVLGFVFFKDFPDAIAWIGMTVIILSGLFVAFQKRPR